MALTQLQKQEALKLLNLFLENGATVSNQGAIYSFEEFDQKRVAALPELKNLVSDFLTEKINLVAFKEKSESFSRTYDYWGFKGFSGQMTLNQMVNWSNQSLEMEKLFRESLHLPKNKEEALLTVKTFIEQAPKLMPKEKVFRKGSVPYFIGYFWQIQNPELIPIQYSSSKNTLIETGLISPAEDVVDFYSNYWAVNDELAELFSGKIDFKKVPKYWVVEHVLWARKAEVLSEKVQKNPSKVVGLNVENAEFIEGDFRQFIPPYLKDYEKLASGEVGVRDSLEFERKTQKIFQMLGYECEALGQGKGRQPDGVAKSNEHRYAIIYDAKSRKDGYSLGTDDRELIEYIHKHEPVLKKSGLMNVYCMVISSSFKSDPKIAIKRIRIETNVKSVVFLTASQLLRVLCFKIENPLKFDVYQFQDLLLEGEQLSSEKIEDFLNV